MSLLTGLKRRDTEKQLRRSIILLWMQITLVVFCCIVFAFVLIGSDGNRAILYSILLVSMFFLICLAFLLNILGKYNASSWLTVLVVSMGPWVSILLDSNVINGDIIPLVYIVLSILISALFLSERATLCISFLQFGALLTLILHNQKLMQMNWPSLLCFVFSASVISIVYSFVNKKQMETIERQNNQLQVEKDTMQKMAEIDPLTGLYNRLYMEKILDEHFVVLTKKETKMAIIMIDIDEFKNINDTHGHFVGDFVLRHTAKILSSKVRAYDSLCRYGGDEFIIIMLECDPENALQRAKILQEALQNAVFKYKGKDIGQITVSIGVASYPECGLQKEEVIKAADRALYVSKKEGRNRVNAAVC